MTSTIGSPSEGDFDAYLAKIAQQVGNDEEALKKELEKSLDIERIADKNEILIGKLVAQIEILKQRIESNEAAQKKRNADYEEKINGLRDRVRNQEKLNNKLNKRVVALGAVLFWTYGHKLWRWYKS